MKLLPQSLLRRPRLLLSIAVGVLIGAGNLLVPPGFEGWTGRVLTAWNTGVWLYLALLAWHMLRATLVKVQAFAEEEDPGARVVVALLSLAAVASLAAIVMELATSRSVPAGDRALHLILTGATLVGSWLLVGVEFVLHYAHLFITAMHALGR
jgi:uncharacterized membrane protein